MISVFVYKLLQKYKNDHTKLTLRLTSDHISFETPVGYLRYGCDHYTFGVKVFEISIFEYFIFGHLIWGNGLTIKGCLERYCPVGVNQEDQRNKRNEEDSVTTETKEISKMNQEDQGGELRPKIMNQELETMLIRAG